MGIEVQEVVEKVPWEINTTTLLSSVVAPAD